MKRTRARGLRLGALVVLIAASLGALLGWLSGGEGGSGQPPTARGPASPIREPGPRDPGRTDPGRRSPDHREAGDSPSPAASSDGPAPRDAQPGRGPVRLSGRILDTAGQPVADCTVTLHRARLDGWLALDPAADTSPAATSISDDAGRFRCILARDHTPLDAVFALLLDHPQFPPQVAATDLRPADRSLDLGDLVLRSAVGLEVTVRSSADGRPLAGAQVGFRPQLLDPWLAGGGADQLARAALAERDGVVRLYGLSDGPLRLRVEAEGHATALRDLPPASAGRATRLQIFLDPGHALAGVVVDADDGRPLADVALRAVSQTRPGVAATTRSDAAGRFRIAGLPSGPCSLDAEAEDRPPHRVNDLRLPTDGALRITLPRGLELSGRVVDADDGSPLAGCRIAVEFPDGRPLRGARLARPTARSDRRGRFRLSGLGPGRIRLHVTSESHVEVLTDPLMLPVTDPAGTGADPQLGGRQLGDIAMSAGRILVGTVLDAAGQPLAGAELHVQHTTRGLVGSRSGGSGSPDARSVVARSLPTRAPAAPTYTGADGRFRARTALPSGAPFRLAVRAVGHAPLLSPALGSGTATVASIGPLECGTLQLLAAVPVTGMVVDAAGRPVADATVTAVPRDPGPDGRPHDTARTDSVGRFKFTALAAGGYRFRATAPALGGTGSSGAQHRPTSITRELDLPMRAGDLQLTLPTDLARSPR